MNNRWWVGSCLGTCVLLGGCSGYSADENAGEAGGGQLSGGDDSRGNGAVGDDDDDNSGDDGDGGIGLDIGPPPTEQEMEADFRIPRASGAFVYSASESTHSVAVIDSTTLAIEVVPVGRRPTVIVPIAPGAAQGAVAVLNQDSDDVSLLRTAGRGQTTVEWRDITPGANNLAVSPDGRFVFAHVDVDGPEEVGPGSDQEVSVIDITREEVSRMSVGAHPRAIEFSPEGDYAYIVTADGVNVVEIGEGSFDGKPDIVPVHAERGIDPTQLEVHVAARHGVALARIEGDPRVVVTDLHLREQTEFTLPGIATDLDLSPDSSFALLVLPSLTGSSRLFELPLPLPDASDIEEYAVPGEYVGLGQIAPDGQTLVLYTSQNPDLQPPTPDGPTGGTDSDTEGCAEDACAEGSSTTDTEGATDTDDTDTDTQGAPSSEGTESSGGDLDAEALRMASASRTNDPRLRVVIARRTDDGWDTSNTLFVDRPVASVGIAPDGLNAILVHMPAPAESVPHAYTMVDLAKAFPVKKTQTVSVPPEPILFTPEGDRAVVMLRAQPGATQRVEQVDLRSFIVDGLTLGSPPEGAGYVESTEKVFVSQAHPTGRITFIDRRGAIETVTGFGLNDAVKD